MSVTDTADALSRVSVINTVANDERQHLQQGGPGDQDSIGAHRMKKKHIQEERAPATASFANESMSMNISAFR